IFPAPGGLWVARWYESGGADAQATAVAQATRATSTSNTQRPAARFARYPAGPSILMLAIVPPLRRPIVAAAMLRGGGGARGIRQTGGGRPRGTAGGAGGPPRPRWRLPRSRAGTGPGGR